MSFNIKNWNQQIQEEIYELELLIEAEKINLQNVQNQIDLYICDPYFEIPNWTTLMNQKSFIASSIILLEQNVSQLRNKIISCC